MSLFQTHLWAIIGLLTGIAGLSTLLDNATFTSSLSNAMPSALATQVITDGSLLAMLAAWILTWLNPSRTQSSYKEEAPSL